MAKKDKQPGFIPNDNMRFYDKTKNIPGQEKFTFEGTLCYKDGKPYGRIVEENDSHIVVELRAESKNEYPQRHEFRKEQNTKKA